MKKAASHASNANLQILKNNVYLVIASHEEGATRRVSRTIILLTHVLEVPEMPGHLLA